MGSMTVLEIGKQEKYENMGKQEKQEKDKNIRGRGNRRSIRSKEYEMQGNMRSIRILEVRQKVFPVLI